MHLVPLIHGLDRILVMLPEAAMLQYPEDGQADDSGRGRGQDN